MAEPIRNLRKRAKERMQTNKAAPSPSALGADSQKLLHELQTHQIELETQKEELLRSRIEMEALLSRYTDLFDFAPVGYFTLDCDGTIRQANLTGAKLLFKERTRLIKRRFGSFVSPADRPVFNEFLQRVFTNRAALSDRTVCEVDLDNRRDRSSSPGLESRPSGEASRRHVHIEARVTEDGRECRAVVVDMTERMRAEVKERRNREAAEHLAEETVIIAEIGRVIGSTLEINKVYDRFAAETKKLILFDSLTVNLYNSQENIMRVTYVSGLNIDGRRQGDPLILEGSLSEAVIRARTGIRIQPAGIDEIAGRFPRLLPILKAGLRSIMCVPLVYRDEVIGVLHFRSKKKNAYTEQDLRLAERVGMQIAGAMVNAQLFSDLEKTENSLRKSEGRFRGLVEMAAVGVAEIEMSTGRFFTVNHRLCEMTGRTEEEMLATTFQAITHPEDIHLHEKKTALLLAGKIGNYSLEKRCLRKDGEKIWVNITVSPLWKPGEKPGRNMVVVEDITERKWMEAEILALSITDQLTGLHNRRGFLSLAEQQLKLAKRDKCGMLLFFADLDGLKWINDKLGHQEGDRALIEAATVLKETFRASDIVARLGGDEYAALAFYITKANYIIVTTRLQTLIDKRNKQKNRRYGLSISLGWSYYDPENSCSIDELMASADKMMYEHKQKKKGLHPPGALLSSGHLYPSE